MPDTHRRAALYVRISDDRDGEAAGVARQESDCRAVADRQGWDVAEVYVENDTSAFKRRAVTLPDGSKAQRVVRPVFRRLLDDLASGHRDALIAYDLDRIARDPRDLEDLIDVVERRSVPTRAVTGEMNLSDDNGVTMARIMVSIANKSSRDTARRVTRKHRELAEAGKFSGGGVRAYGYAPDGITVVEAEAEIVREIAAAVIAGQSLHSIAKDLNAREVPSTRGNGWQTRSVHSVVTKPRNAGLREFRGEVVGPAAWPAILDREIWENVKLALAERAHGSTNNLQRWLTGVVYCGECDAPLVGSLGNGGPRYWCAPPRSTSAGAVGARQKRNQGCGKIAVTASRVEQVAEEAILHLLTRPEGLAQLDAVTPDAAAHARQEAAADEAQLKELAELWSSRAVTTAEYLAARRQITARLEDWRGVIARATPATLRALVSADDVRAAWDAFSPADRREAARHFLGHGLTVNRSTARGGVWDPNRVVARKVTT